MITDRQLLTLKSSYKPGRKYRNIPCEADGIKFDSRAEARRYGALKLLERGGVITQLVVKPQFPMVVAGANICTYIADYSYHENGVLIVEDVKSKATKTPVYRIKAKLLKALYGITVREVA
jgi:hypothetical protein